MAVEQDFTGADRTAANAPQAPAKAVDTHLRYRSDIDGLRALAVVPVVLNHATVRGFWGGYVGVDIFFVISGFLITSIIVKDLEAERHSIANFYRRRVLRIFPALFVMLAAVTAVAAFTMLPTELVRYGRSLASTTLFGSNILFYFEAGYFEPAARLKPLLHTWSLAIEEQFYLLWPILLALIGPHRRAHLKALVLGATAVSLVAAIWMVRADASAAFYLIPARAWELSLGAMVALFPMGRRPQWLNEALALAGLAAILFAIRYYSEATVFPGAAALLPCLGAAALIFTGGQGSLVARLLSFAPIVFIGQISYSLYLWHWPVMVFSEVALFLPKTALVVSGEVLLSFVLAILSWRFVEQPFRTGASRWSTRVVLLWGAAAMAVAVGVAAVLLATQGLAARFTPEQQRVAAYEALKGDALYREGSCFITAPRGQLDEAQCLLARGDRPSLLVVGDSHAAHLWPGLARYTNRLDVLQATRTGCKPVLYDADADPCHRFFRTMLTRWLPAHPPGTLLLAARWRMSDLPLLDRTLADPVVRASNPLLLGPVPQYDTTLPRLLVFAERRSDPNLPQRSLDKGVIETDRAMATLARRHGVRYISMVERLCGQGTCTRWAAPEIPLQFDYGHFTAEGSQRAIDRIAPDILAGAQR